MPSPMLPTASLLAGAGAVVLRASPPTIMHHKTLAVMPMQMFRADCTVAVKNGAKNPGAGMTPDSMQPFQQVLKDGYYGVECVDDFMFLHGDKFGDNKFSYEIGETSNVSIVLYDSHVAKEDRETMTPDVCFRFCRTLEDMTFFGIRNGNKCYCTPYYKSVAGDDSMCDVVCEGDGTQICGSTTKSSMFGMHMCSNTQANLNTIAGNAQTMSTDLASFVTNLTAASGGMQSAAAEYQTMFSSAGDPVAADLMQSAKVHAGKLSELANSTGRLQAKLVSTLAEATGMSSADFSQAAQVTAADDVASRLEALSADGVAAFDEMTTQFESAVAGPAAAAVAEQYYHAMYFVDKANINASTTCGGTASHSPVVGNLAACSAACDADIHECVGFSYFPKAGSLTQEEGLCFLMSGFKTLTYYTGCGGQSAAVDHEDVKCMVKFSKFEGTSLAVDGTGKCKECFREVTHADRCFV